MHLIFDVFPGSTVNSCRFKPRHALGVSTLLRNWRAAGLAGAFPCRPRIANNMTTAALTLSARPRYRKPRPLLAYVDRTCVVRLKRAAPPRDSIAIRRRRKTLRESPRIIRWKNAAVASQTSAKSRKSSVSFSVESARAQHLSRLQSVPFLRHVE